ncbi:MAG: hypothetical protein M3Q85_15480, partial [Acidobacteriota bacterium]|nr:hypothetical protein [Acidobacteriota bacterium]
SYRHFTLKPPRIFVRRWSAHRGATWACSSTSGSRGELVRLGGGWSYRADTRTLAIRLTHRASARTFAMPLQVGIYTGGSATPTMTTVQLAGASHESRYPLIRSPIAWCWTRTTSC